MKEERTVSLLALWDFSGPEGTATGVGRGLVKKGQVFFTTSSRAGILIAAGKASTIIPVPEPKRDGPTHARSDAPESFRYEELTAAEVMEKVERGVLTVNQALELERARDVVRSTLVARLEKLRGE